MTQFVTFISLRGVTAPTALGSLIHLLTQGGRLRLADVVTEPRAPDGPHEYAVAPARDGWVSVVCPEPFEALAADLSRLLGCPAFMFHLHGEDSWFYWFYLSGRLADRFDSLPDYWGDVTPAERQETAGAPRLLADKLGADAALLARYLARDNPATWDEQLEAHGDDYDAVDLALDMLDADARPHPDDRFDVWDPRVMFDFMRRLGITPPLEPDGRASEPLTLVRLEPTA